MKFRKPISLPKIIGITVAGLLGIMIMLPVAGEVSDAKQVTLDSLKSTILSDNLDIIRANETVMIAKYKKDKAEANSGTGNTQVDFEMNTKYYPVEAKMNLDFTTWDAERIKRETTLNGTKLYLRYDLLIKEIALQNAKLIRLNTELETTKKQIALGKLKASAQTEAELTIKKETYALEQLMKEREEIYLDLNALLHYQLDATLEIKTIEIPFEVYVDKDIAKTVSDLLNNQGELIKLEQVESLAGIKLAIYTTNNSDGKYDKDIIALKEDLSLKSLDIKDKQLDIEYQVRSKYNTLRSKMDTVEIKQLETDNAKMTYDTLVKRQKLGFETAATVNAAKEALDYAAFSVEQAKLEYYLAVEDYKNYCFSK